MKKVNLTNRRQTFVWKSPLIFLIAICCGFTLVSKQANAQAVITCPVPNDLGIFACGDDVPPPPVDEATVTAPPYGVTITGIQGTIVIISGDDPIPDACAGGGIGRNITILDDLDGNGTADPGEVIGACTFTYILEGDDTDPTFDAAPAAIADIACSDPLPTQETLTASDNCATVTVTPSVDPFVEDVCAGYEITYRWTTEDDCGNEAVETVIFNVLPDMLAPTFNEALPADLDLICSDAIPVAATLTATDNCDDAPSVGFIEGMIGTCPDATVITRVWTAADACGNELEHIQTITITPDITPPVLSAMPVDINLTCADAIPPATEITATDDCTAPITVSLMENDDMGVCPDPRIITRTWTATDECMNEVSHTQTIHSCGSYLDRNG